MKQASFKNLKCECGNQVKVDAGTTAVTCSTCVTGMVGLTVKNKPSEQDLEIRRVRKIAIQKAKEIKAKRQAQFAGFPRGWWLRAAYTHTDGRLFEYGKKVKAFTQQVKVARVSSGRPRGWHLRKEFVDKDGQRYTYGQLV